MNTVRLNDKEYEVTGYADDGLPIIRGIATTTEDGFDEQGNKKVSVNITVPAIDLTGIPGEVK
jgi:hypothetical protein